MSKLLLSGVAAVALVVAINGPVLAADMMVRKAPPPVPAGCDWCGFYFGGHTGYGSSRSTFLGSDRSTIGNRARSQ